MGALYVRKGVNLAPRAFGGRQERGLRVGTEPTALIAGFGRAVEELDPVRAGEHAARLAEELRQGLARLPGVAVNSPAQGLPWVISLSVPGIRSETMIHYLEQQGVYVSSGSACAKGARSHVLCAMGLEDPVIDGALRVSFCKHSTSQDVAGFLAALESGMSALQRAGETTKNGRAR